MWGRPPGRPQGRWACVLSNRLLLAGIGVALVFAAAVVYLPVMHGIFGTEALTAGQIATVAPFPVIVWGADELRRLILRHYHRPRPA